jgi:multicomponent Na+:H+ antiporter subunit E
MLFAIWCVLVGSVSGFAYAPIFVVLALAISSRLSGATMRWRATQLPRFAAFFLRHSLYGGIDVARRALDPRRLSLAPRVHRYRLRLTGPDARIFFINTLSLMPGTLAMAVEVEWLYLHVLDERLPFERTLRETEACVADLFGERLHEH